MPHIMFCIILFVIQQETRYIHIHIYAYLPIYTYLNTHIRVHVYIYIVYIYICKQQMRDLYFKNVNNE